MHSLALLCYSPTLMNLETALARLCGVVSAKISVGTNIVRLLKWSTMAVMFGDISSCAWDEGKSI